MADKVAPPEDPGDNGPTADETDPPEPGSAIKLTRMGHYHAGDQAGDCFAGLISGVHAATDEGQNVDIQVWPHRLHDAVDRAGTGNGLRASITVPVGPPSDTAAGTFHLSQDCPWGR